LTVRPARQDAVLLRRMTTTALGKRIGKIYTNMKKYISSTLTGVTHNKNMK